MILAKQVMMFHKVQELGVNHILIFDRIAS